MLQQTLSPEKPHLAFRRATKAKMTPPLVPSLTSGSSCPSWGLAGAKAKSKDKLWSTLPTMPQSTMRHVRALQWLSLTRGLLRTLERLYLKSPSGALSLFNTKAVWLSGYRYLFISLLHVCLRLDPTSMQMLVHMAGTLLYILYSTQAVSWQYRGRV